MADSKVAASFMREGFVGPVRLFSDAECKLISARLRNGSSPAPADWEKGRAVTDRFFYDLAVNPTLLALLTQLLGKNVILWGASIIRRKPGQSHAWHTDMESSAESGGFVSVWVGIENTSRASSLQFIRRSHSYGKAIQQAEHEHGLSRGKTSPETLLGWVREREQLADLDQLELSDGEAVLFDGRLWHGSHNGRSEGERTALLLQYAAADVPVRMPNPGQFEWPFRHCPWPLPPVVLISGSDHHSVNRLVPAPPKWAKQPLASTWIHPLNLPLADDTDKGWRPHGIFKGSTRILDKMQCHASVLSPGYSPHPPHKHPEEELLIVLDGEADVVFAEDPDGTNARVERLRRGMLAYYPPDQHHTIRNSSQAPVTYLMFKWLAGKSGAKEPLGTSIFRYSDAVPEEAKPYKANLFQQPTVYLGKLRAHLTTVQPNGGYAPHVDAYDVAILLLSGKVETLGQVVEPYTVIFYSAGEPHGMRNVGDEPARYLVLEFRSSGSPTPTENVKRSKRAASAAETSFANSRGQSARAKGKRTLLAMPGVRAIAARLADLRHQLGKATRR